jgi:hypothetical protein
MTAPHKTKRYFIHFISHQQNFCTSDDVTCLTDVRRRRIPKLLTRRMYTKQV